MSSVALALIALLLYLTGELVVVQLGRLLQNCWFRVEFSQLLLFLKGLQLPFEYSLIIVELFLENSYVFVPLTDPDFVKQHGIQH